MKRKSFINLNFALLLVFAIYIGFQLYTNSVSLKQLPCFHYCTAVDCSFDHDTPQAEIAGSCRINCSEEVRAAATNDPLIGVNSDQQLAPFAYWLSFLPWLLLINAAVLIIQGIRLLAKKEKALGRKNLALGVALTILAVLLGFIVLVSVSASHLVACM